jgi:hypothetical protein
MSHISANDLIFYKEGGNIMSGGFSVESILLNKGEAPMYTANSLSSLEGGGEEEQQGGGKHKQKQNQKQIEGKQVSSVFKNLAVPTGLLYQSSKESNKRSHFNYNENYDAESMAESMAKSMAESMAEGNKGKKGDKSNKVKKEIGSNLVISEDIHSLLMKMAEVGAFKKNKSERTLRKTRKLSKENEDGTEREKKNKSKKNNKKV